MRNINDQFIYFLHKETTGRIIRLMQMETRNKAEKREKLLDQGVQMLTTQGYHGTGLKQLLASVAIPKGSFYHYFQNKEAFAAEVIQHYIEPFILRLEMHLLNSADDALLALKRYFMELIAELEQNDFKGGCLLGNMMGEVGDTSEACRQSLQHAVQRYRNLQQKALEMAQQQGTVRTDRSAESMVDLLTNSWQGALLRMKIEQSSAPLRQCCDDLLDDYFRP